MANITIPMIGHRVGIYTNIPSYYDSLFHHKGVRAHKVVGYKVIKGEINLVLNSKATWGLNEEIPMKYCYIWD